MSDRWPRPDFDIRPLPRDNNPEASRGVTRDGLTEAWSAAESALPEYWYIRSLIVTNIYKAPVWEVVAATSKSMRVGRGSTPAAALRALADLFR